MSKQKNLSSKPLTPEQIILKKLRHLADLEEVISFFTKLVWMVILMFILFGVLFGITAMKNNDMMPRISSGDLILYYRLEQKFRSQDVVVFQKNGKQYIGRIIAKGGECVEVTNDSKLIINNSTVYESDIYYSTPKYGDEMTYPVFLESNQYFILCDYREGARDSRYFGAVDQSEIKGKVITVIRRSGL